MEQHEAALAHQRPVSIDKTREHFLKSRRAEHDIRYIASIGALITVLSIAFDTFVQQILTIEMHDVDIKLAGQNLSANNILPYTRAHTYSLKGTASKLLFNTLNSDHVQISSKMACLLSDW